MTFFDLCNMVRHYWIIVITVVLICLIGSALIYTVTFSPKYTATATIVAADPSGNLTTDQLLSTVQSIALNTENEMSNESVEVKGSLVKTTGSQYYELSATTPDPSLSVESVNTAANKIANSAKDTYNAMQKTLDGKLQDYTNNSELFKNLGGNDIDMIRDITRNDEFSFCQFMVETAKNAKQQGSPLGRFIAAGVIIGVLLSFCGLALYGYIRRPVVNRKSLEDKTDIPVWAIKPKKSEILWANIQFADDSIPASICLLPVRGNSKELSSALVHSIDASGNSAVLATFGKVDAQINASDCINVFACDSISKDASSLWCARQSEVTIICVWQWHDRIEDLEEAIQEVELAKAKIAGIAYIGN